MNPHLVLGVPIEANDAQIRRAYLDAIKVATPESQPERFKNLTAAYDQIKDETSRFRYELFHTDSPGDSPMDVFLRHAWLSPKRQPLPFEDIKEFLRACSKT